MSVLKGLGDFFTAFIDYECIGLTYGTAQVSSALKTRLSSRESSL